MIRRGGQLLTVNFNGGEPLFDRVVDVTGGLSFDVTSVSEVAPAVETAVTAASDRYVVRFAGQSEADARGDLTLQVGSASSRRSPTTVPS